MHAIAGLGTAASRIALPPATAPGSLARALAQGVVQGRLPRTAKGAGDDPPQPVEEIHNEGQRSVVELGTLLWHAMDGQRDAPELAPWMIPPQADPIVALSLSRKRVAEYGQREAIDRSCAFPGDRVWLIEIERAKGDVPAGIAVWRSPGADREWMTRCACVWTRGRIGSTTHPLVIGAQWAIEGNGASAGGGVIGPSWEDATRAAADGSRNAVLARRQNAIGKQMIARIVVPAALAWLDAHAGNARPAGHVGEGGTREATEHAPCRPPSRIVVPVPGAPRTPAPAWLTAEPERAVEAIVIGAAREGYRIGASSPVEAWRRGWAGYAEMGAVAWHAIADLKAQIDAETWRAMERTLDEDGLEERSMHPALAATSDLVRKMLEQTGRSHVARATDARTLCGLEIPRRLWRALGEAGPRPAALAAPQLSERWWIVEIEAPGDDEPNAIALWEADGAEVALAGFLCPGERGGPPFVTVVTWRTSADGERSSEGLAALRTPVHADDPENPESRAGLKQIIEALTAPHTGPIARAKTAIALHLANNAQAPALRSYRPSAGSARARGDDAGARPPRSITALFAIERAPEPETAQAHAKGSGHSRAGGGRLEERQRVRAHFKRQAFGPRLSRRRLIVIEGYRRGPKPEDHQIVVTRLAEGELQAGRNTLEKRRHKRRRRSGRTL